ncbi:MAG: orotidine-5'-phosphate decarboxylase [Oscillospiraceae bacterium]|nr:orotidine-5'-phosphate decarboxylase [Oscillospiraceae bacterium]
MNKDVIIACDFENKAELLGFLKKIKTKKLFLKIGMELFYREGPEIINFLKDLGHRIFLDLKLCDIPNTVKSAVFNLTKLNIDMITVHAFGSKAMIESAKDGLLRSSREILLIVVTILTSISDEILKKELMIKYSLKKTVLNYAKEARKSGADGVVCSVHEAKEIKRLGFENFLCVTPGIRYKKQKDDQMRTATPIEAKKSGSDFIVVGRPITRSKYPILMYEKIYKDFLGENHE